MPPLLNPICAPGSYVPVSMSGPLKPMIFDGLKISAAYPSPDIAPNLPPHLPANFPSLPIF